MKDFSKGGLCDFFRESKYVVGQSNQFLSTNKQNTDRNSQHQNLYAFFWLSKRCKNITTGIGGCFVGLAGFYRSCQFLSLFYFYH